MLYTTLKIGEKDYKLRMSSAKAVEVEQEIGKNPVNVLIDTQTGRLPLMSETMAIFWGALTYYQHGIKREAVYDIYDAYIEDGHTYLDFIQDVLISVFETAGYFKREDLEAQDAPKEDDGKN